VEQLIDISNRLINNTSSQFTRSLYRQIDWNSRLIEIRGARGVGKTTLMQQKAKSLTESGENALYVSLDQAYFYREQLFNTVDHYFKYGGKYLFLDEVHKYPEKEKNLDWSQEIKNIYDAFPQLYLVYSGSSLLQLYKGQGDLSRRKAGYLLPGLSFREFLEFKGLLSHQPVNLSDLLQNHQSLANEISTKLKILPAFREYLRHGYYPFFDEAPDKFFDRLNDVINVILENDIPAITDISYETSFKLKKLLSLLASSVPYTPNLSNLTSQLYVADQRTLLKYINFLEKAELVDTLGAKSTGNQILNKPQKIYLNNSNLMYALSKNLPDPGTERETFFFNQLKHLHTISYPKQGDFLVEQKYLFEIGGKNKSQQQIRDHQEPYVVRDEIETGFGQIIPLWLFGFLY
jgi:predicted AAA+ superfamily ATPase